jgi:hypothetical protein
MSSLDFIRVKTQMRLLSYSSIDNNWTDIPRIYSSLLKLALLGVLGRSGVLGRLVVKPMGESMGLTFSRLARLRGVGKDSIAGFSKLWILIGGGRRITRSDAL